MWLGNLAFSVSNPMTVMSGVRSLTTALSSNNLGQVVYTPNIQILFMLNEPTAVNDFREYLYLTPACADLPKTRGSELKLLISGPMFNAENFVRMLYWSILSHFGAIHS